MKVQRSKRGRILIPRLSPVLAENAEKLINSPENHKLLGFRFSLSLHRFDNLRVPLCSPLWDKGTAITLACNHGRNRKLRSELSDLLSSGSLSSYVGLASYDHPRAHYSKTNLLVSIWCRKVAGGGRWWSEVTRQRQSPLPFSPPLLFFLFLENYV